MRSMVLALLLAWHVIGLAGCALVGRQAKLYHPPAPEEGESPPPTVAADPAAPPVRVTVTDARPEPREELGPIRNGFGMKMAAVTTQDDVPAWVTSALVAEFEAAGIRVAPAPSPGPSDDVSMLAVEVQKVQCDAHVSYSAEVILASQRAPETGPGSRLTMARAAPERTGRRPKPPSRSASRARSSRPLVAWPRT